jgi:GTPase SAR1 family protein
MASVGQPSLSKDAIRRYIFAQLFGIGTNWCRKLVIIGDGACGKTSLLSVFTLGYFPKVVFPRHQLIVGLRMSLGEANVATNCI